MYNSQSLNNEDYLNIAHARFFLLSFLSYIGSSPYKISIQVTILLSISLDINVNRWYEHLGFMLSTGTSWGFPPHRLRSQLGYSGCTRLSSSKSHFIHGTTAPVRSVSSDFSLPPFCSPFRSSTPYLSLSVVPTVRLRAFIFFQYVSLPFSVFLSCSFSSSLSFLEMSRVHS